jgi:ribosomal protein S18 acetylase RimI-like enzyme
MVEARFVSRTQVAARSHFQYAIRQAGIADRAALREFLTGLSQRARYLRFFSGAPPTSQAMLRILTGETGCSDALVATEDGVIIGHAMASDIPGPGGGHRTEIGVVVADGRRGLGVGSALVRCLLARAHARGATTVVMEVLAENRQVIAMVTDHWPVTSREQSGAHLTIHAWLPRPGDREWSELQVPRLSGAQLPRAQEERHSGRLAGTR